MSNVAFPDDRRNDTGEAGAETNEQRASHACAGAERAGASTSGDAPDIGLHGHTIAAPSPEVLTNQSSPTERDIEFSKEIFDETIGKFELLRAQASKTQDLDALNKMAAEIQALALKSNDVEVECRAIAALKVQESYSVGYVPDKNTRPEFMAFPFEELARKHYDRGLDSATSISSGLAAAELLRLDPTSEALRSEIMGRIGEHRYTRLRGYAQGHDIDGFASGLLASEQVSAVRIACDSILGSIGFYYGVAGPIRWLTWKAQDIALMCGFGATSHEDACLRRDNARIAYHLTKTLPLWPTNMPPILEQTVDRSKLSGLLNELSSWRARARI
jgi:hypothetical protein